MVWLYLFLSLLVFGGPQELTYQGRLYNEFGDPLTSGEAHIVLQIRSNDGQCLLFEESHSKDMSDSSGFFSLSIGTGSQNTVSGPNMTVSQAMGNSTVLADPNLECAGTVYNPSQSDGRLLRVFVNGSALEPDLKIGSAPFALNSDNSQTLEGKSYSDITNYSDSNLAGAPVPQTSAIAIGDSLRWNGTSWESYTPSSGGGGSSTGAGNGLETSGSNLAVKAGTNILVSPTGVHVEQGTGSGLDADLLDGQEGSYYLDWGNFTSVPSVTSGAGLTGGGSLVGSQTLSHADTSSQSSIDNSGGTVIQDIAVDTYGHVTSALSVNLDSRFLNNSGDTMSGDLEVTGNIKLGSSSAVCNAGAAGAMRYVSGDILFCDGSNWQTISRQGGSIIIENRTSDPASPTVGQIWLRTDL